jgi:hypothetical protein
LHSGHEVAGHRTSAREAEVAEQRQELPHYQIDHGESNSRSNSRYDGDGFQEIESRVTESENPLDDTLQLTNDHVRSRLQIKRTKKGFFPCFS